MKNNIKGFVIYLFIIFSFQSWTKADDISDFEIEGMSIGDSLLDYFSEEEINENVADYYNDDKFSTSQLTLQKFEIYKNIDVSFLTKDKNYKIADVTSIHPDANTENCKSIKNKVTEDIKKFLRDVNYIFEEKIESHAIDESGKSKVHTSYFYFPEKKENISRDLIAVQCYFFSENMPYADGLKIGISLGEFVSWLYNKAYK